MRTFRLGDRLRFAGQHRLIDGGFAFRDHAVGGHLFARLDQQPIAVLQLRHGNIRYGSVFEHQMGGVRHQARELFERLAGAHHRFHLDPVAEKHDRNQRRQFPKEGFLRTGDGDDDAVDVGG